MAASDKLVDKSVLRTLVPPSALNAENFEELARKAFREEISAGRMLFKQGDVDRKNVYLLEGEVEFFNEDGNQGKAKAGTPETKHALANTQPRQYSAKTTVNCVVTRFDSDLLDILLTWDQLSGIEVADITMDDDSGEDDGDDWMTRILQSKAFLRIPPANIQHMFMRLQEVPVKAGTAVINQGDDGDYYYIISSGNCKVTRQAASGSVVTLATLKDGDAFGEEALLSEGKRNASIIADTDCHLMRLSKTDFEELLKAPMLHEVSLDTAKTMVRAGAVLLDVRLEPEHKAGSIKGSMNIPLNLLRLRSEGLDMSKKYICYCETGRRSSAAAFLLTERGFEGVVLQGGLQAFPQPAPTKNAS
jgi:CRP-like cAMP-binding protein